MSSADLILSLARESECGLRECLQSELYPESVDVVNSDVHSAFKQGSAQNMVDECFSFVALLSQTVAFSCRRNFLHSALDALARSAARLSQSIDVDFPYRVAAGDNVGDLYSWNCPLLHMLPGLQEPKDTHKRRARDSENTGSKSKHATVGSPNKI
jgi:hypothetical protein